jgi:hypothetical protein
MAEADNTIALGVRPPQMAAGGAAINPFDAIEKIARTQNELNTAKNFNATFAARQELGQIYSLYGDDPDTLASKIAQSPASAFFPEAFTQAKNAALLGTQQANVRGEMSGNIMKDWGLSMGTLYANPTTETWLNLKSAALARAFDPKVRAAVSDQMDSLGHAMLDGTDGNPDRIRQNIIANGMHFGMTPETAASLQGPIGVQEFGGGRQYVRGPSPVFGGAPTALSPVVPSGVAPQPVTGRTSIMPGITTGLPFPQNPPPPGAVAPNALSPAVAAPAVQPTQADDSQAPPAAAAAAAAPAPTQAGAQPGQVYGAGLHYGTEREKDVADHEKILDDNVKAGADLYKNMDEIYGLAKKAHLGGGASAYLALGKALQAAGVHNPTVDAWANGSSMASEVIDKLSLNDAMGQMRTQLAGAGRYNRNEFLAYMSKNPGIATDPRAMVEIFNMWTAYYQRDKAEQNALAAAKKEPGFDIGTWPQRWQDSGYMKNFASGAPFTGEGVLGVLPEKGPHGAFLPRNPKELQELPEGAPYYQPGDDTSQGPRTWHTPRR